MISTVEGVNKSIAMVVRDVMTRFSDAILSAILFYFTGGLGTFECRFVVGSSTCWKL